MNRPTAILPALAAAVVFSGAALAQQPEIVADSNLGPAVVLESQAAAVETDAERRNRYLLTGAAIVGAVILGAAVFDDDDDEVPMQPPTHTPPVHHAPTHG